jgi:histidinol-phosphate aminotransferase
LNNHIKPGPGIMQIKPYAGGKSGFIGKKSIKLSSNESALGPSLRVKEAFLKSLDSLAIYPDGKQYALKEAIAKNNNLDINQIICGAGSDEILTLIGNAYLTPGDEVIYPEHAFVLYKIITLANGAIPIAAPEKDLTADVDSILNLVTSKTKIIFIANPNNPTGTYLSSSEIKRLQSNIPENILLIIDGAYAEYVMANNYDCGVELVSASNNVVMTRTFSKVHALASLRIGWAYCPSHIIDVLDRIRGPFNVSIPSIMAGSAAMNDIDHVNHSVAHNAKWRDHLHNFYTELGIKVIPSVANFLLLDFKNLENINSNTLEKYLNEKNIYIRNVADYGLPTHLRITIGSEKDNETLLGEIQKYVEDTRI